MEDIWSSPLFGIFISIFAFWTGIKIQQKLKLTIFNPLLLAIFLILLVLTIFHIPYDSYNRGGAVINMFLSPATACLAVSIYTKIQILKKNWIPIVVGCTAGSITSMTSVYFLCRLFKLDDAMTWSLIPKSVTTPIAVGIASSHNGVVPVTVIAVIFTGILGSILAPAMIKLFRVNDSVTAGLSIGSCSHAMGTSKAIEIGETEGAMSGLAIGVCGLITVMVSMFLS